MNYKILPIEKKHIQEFWAAVDSVALEQKYLAFLQGPPIEITRELVLGHINNDWPQVVA